jgi:aspartyl-tRNA(Asn)/glutamyl-tRNA(Gln) amidotransferase subunit B
VLESLGVSDVRMEEGSLRCDANVSVRPRGSAELGTKVEVKNLNSVRSLYRAVRFEEERQRAALDADEELVQETRHFDEGTGTTSSMRSKEFAFDYRYFPEPDLAPLEPDAEWIDGIRAALPELPATRRARLASAYALEASQAAYLSADPETAAFFEEAVALGGDARAVAKWMASDLAALLNEERTTVNASKVTPAHLADLVKLVDQQVIGSPGAKAALIAAFRTGESIEQIVEREGLRQVSDASALDAVIDKVIAENPGPVEQYRAGKDAAINALIGPVMQETKRAASPQVVRDLLTKRLSAG